MSSNVPNSGKKPKTSPPLQTFNFLRVRQTQKQKEEELVVKQTRRQGYREKVQVEVTGILDETRPFFHKRRTNTYLHSFFQVSDWARVIFQLLHFSTEELDTLWHFFPGVYKGSDVLLP